jgi:hypothetical protein
MPPRPTAGAPTTSSIYAAAGDDDDESLERALLAAVSVWFVEEGDERRPTTTTTVSSPPPRTLSPLAPPHSPSSDARLAAAARALNAAAEATRKRAAAGAARPSTAPASLSASSHVPLRLRPSLASSAAPAHDHHGRHAFPSAHRTTLAASTSLPPRSSPPGAYPAPLVAGCLRFLAEGTAAVRREAQERGVPVLLLPSLTRSALAKPHRLQAQHVGPPSAAPAAAAVAARPSTSGRSSWGPVGLCFAPHPSTTRRPQTAEGRMRPTAWRPSTSPPAPALSRLPPLVRPSRALPSLSLVHLNMPGADDTAAILQAAVAADARGKGYASFAEAGDDFVRKALARSAATGVEEEESGEGEGEGEEEFGAWDREPWEGDSPSSRFWVDSARGSAKTYVRGRRAAEMWG